MVTPPPRAPVAKKTRRSRAELMAARMEAPPLPDSLSMIPAPPAPDLDRQLGQPASPVQAGSIAGGTEGEPAPTTLEPQPPQRVVLGMLPAIMVEIVHP